jgi:hypothetical protein
LLIAPTLLPLLFLTNASTPDNHPPTAIDDTYTVHGRITPPGNSMLENDTDPDGDALHLSACGAVSHGTLNCDYSHNAFAYSDVFAHADSHSHTYANRDACADDRSRFRRILLTISFCPAARVEDHLTLCNLANRMAINLLTESG